MKKLISASISILQKFFPAGVDLSQSENNSSSNETEELPLEPTVEPSSSIEELITPVALKKALFTYTPLKDIEENLPLILNALDQDGLLDASMVCYALATLYVENDKFKPIAERPSKYSTKSGLPPYDFSNYVGKGGNKNLQEASLYRGSGFIQLTTKANYAYWDDKLNLDGGLLEHGYEAGNEVHIAAAVFSGFIKDREDKIRQALAVRNFKAARQQVNGRAALHWEKLQVGYLKIEKLLG